MIAEPISLALNELPIPSLPAGFEGLEYRSQFDTRPLNTPCLVVADAGTTNVTRHSLRQVMWEVTLYTDPDIVTAGAPEVLEKLEAHLNSQAFTDVLRTKIPAPKVLLHWYVTGMPPMKIDDRTVVDQVAGKCHIGINAPE